MLIDPPLYDPYAGRPSAAESPVTTSTAPSAPAAAPAASSTAPPQTFSTFSGNEFGPVSQIDTLWSIANQIRPDSSVSTQQMMLALLRANPEAFIENNINGLRQGQILRIPDREEMVQTSQEQAFAEVRSQNTMWEDMRGSIAASATQRPESTASQSAGGTAPASVQNDSELRLLAQGDGSSSGQTGGTSSADNANFALLEEQINTLSAENTDLQDRLAENEALIDDLRRLIELKDDELAVLQQQIAAAGEDMPQGQITDDATTVVDEEETAAVAPEPEVAMEEAEAPPSAVSAPAPAPVQQQGMVDQILGLVMGNIMIVGGAAALLVLLGLFAYTRKQKAGAAEEDTAVLPDFPDFDGQADETGLPETAAPEISADGEPGSENDEFDVEIDTGAEDSEEKPAEATAADSDSDDGGADADEDPLAEVNVFLAYEHFDQAEEFVRDAIKKEPENLDFHSKLLEVFYSSGDKVKYEEEARVLHELVNGDGPHWEMATIMWQELSPNRALFEETDDEDDGAGEDSTSSRGIVDLTADNDSVAGTDDEDDAGLDFDLGTDSGKDSSESDDKDDVLDITAGAEDVLDVTAATSEDATDEDLLDVTAAVGLDSTGDSESSDDNWLDIESESGSESDAASGDDLLDVTAHTDIDTDDNEDLLDVTAAVSTEAESESMPAAGEDLESGQDDDNSLDFDIGGMDVDTPAGDEDTGAEQTSSADENMIDFDLPETEDNADDDAGISLDSDSSDETGS
ncbi:MAG: FimV/HubP family polar landmark protein, partial [Gammaproteobacteria bacterium]